MSSDHAPSEDSQTGVSGREGQPGHSIQRTMRPPWTSWNDGAAGGGSRWSIATTAAEPWRCSSIAVVQWTFGASNRSTFAQSRRSISVRMLPTAGTCSAMRRTVSRAGERAAPERAKPRTRGASCVRGERRGSNPRPPGPQPGALPTELRPPRRADDSEASLRRATAWMCRCGAPVGGASQAGDFAAPTNCMSPRTSRWTAAIPASRRAPVMSSGPNQRNPESGRPRLMSGRIGDGAR